MTTVFPVAIDSLPRPSSNTKRNAGGGLNLSTVIDNISDAIEALENVEAGEPTLNPIVNAALDLWQDGTSFASIADGTWGPDGFIYNKSGAVVHDLLRSTDVPTVAQAQKANYSLHLDVTTADASIAAGDFCTIATRIEGFRWKRFDQKVWSIGFWVKAAKTGVHYIYARNSGNDRSCVMPITVLAADTWEYKTVTFPANPSAGTWDYTNGRGLELGWTLAAGSTFQTTAGAWQTGNYKAASDQVNELDNTANNFRIALIGPPTVGPVAAPFRPVDAAIEELRASRYNEVLNAASPVITNPFANGFWSGTGGAAADTANGTLTYRPKRAAPTITLSAAGDFYAAAVNLGQVIGSTYTIFYPGISSAWLQLVCTTTGGIGGYGTFFGFYSTTNGRVYIRSRIP